MRLLPTKSARGRSVPLTAERVVNLYPEQAPTEARSPVVLHGCPGLSLFATVGTGPIRGMIKMNDVLYVLSGQKLYSINSSGTATELGTVASASGNVRLSHNGEQVVVSNGSNDYMDGYFLFAGATWGYTYSTAAGFQAITDADFPPTTDSNTFFISDLLDGQVFDALDFASAESYPDPLVRLFRDHQELILFGAESTEIWQNAGNADFPFAPITGASIEKGLGAFNSVQKLDNSVVWLDNEGIVRRAGSGWNPERISDHGVEYYLNKARAAGTMGNCTSFTYAEEGHEFYALTIPSYGTWVYDAATNLWHERKSYDLDRFRGDHYVHCYNKHLVGDYDSGQIWQMDLDRYEDNSDPVVAEIIFPTVYAEGKRFIVDKFEVVGEHGVGLVTGQGSDPQYMLDWSADGGKTWGEQYWRDIGAIGDYTERPEWRRIGMFRQWTPRLQISDPVKRAIYTAHVDIRVCSS